MPFDFKKYDAKCAILDGDALQLEWEHYTRLISGAATSTAVSGAAIPFTLGVSSLGVGLVAPAIHNARKKREIIEKHLQRAGRTHHTRKRDVITAGAISGTVGLVTLGLAPIGADAICNSAAERGIAYIAENELAVKVATHLTLDAAAVAAEEHHMSSKKEQEARRAYSQYPQPEATTPLPISGLNIPVATNNQVVGCHTTHQDTSVRIAPAVHVTPPLRQKTSPDAAVMYFPPPPGQADLKPESPYHYRSLATPSSFDTQKSSARPFQYWSEGHLEFGTATAISAPIIGSQSYSNQLPSHSSHQPTSKGFMNHMQPQSTLDHQYQTQNHESRAYSKKYFNGYSNYMDDQHFEGLHGAPRQPPLPHPAPMPSLPPRSPCTPAAPVNLGRRLAWHPHCNVNHCATVLQQNFHAPAEMVHSAYNTSHQVGHQKLPQVCQYEVQSPVPNISWTNQPIPISTNATRYYTTPNLQPTRSRAEEKSTVQHKLYFPPPPTGY